MSEKAKKNPGISDSEVLSKTLEGKECLLPEGKIRDLYLQIHPCHKPAFLTYITEKLNMGDWVEGIILAELEANARTKEIISGVASSSNQIRAAVFEQTV